MQVSLLIVSFFSKSELLHFEFLHFAFSEIVQEHSLRGGESWSAYPPFVTFYFAKLQQVAKMTCNLVSTPHFDTV